MTRSICPIFEHIKTFDLAYGDATTGGVKVFARKVATPKLEHSRVLGATYRMRATTDLSLTTTDLAGCPHPVRVLP